MYRPQGRVEYSALWRLIMSDLPGTKWNKCAKKTKACANYDVLITIVTGIYSTSSSYYYH